MALELFVFFLPVSCSFYRAPSESWLASAESSVAGLAEGEIFCRQARSIPTCLGLSFWGPVWRSSCLEPKTWRGIAWGGVEFGRKTDNFFDESRASPMLQCGDRKAWYDILPFSAVAFEDQSNDGRQIMFAARRGM